MYEIVFISGNSISIDTVKNVLSPPDFHLDAFYFPESAGAVSSNTSLVIVDICGAEIKSDPFYKDFFKSIAAFKKPVIIIMDRKEPETVQQVIKVCGIPDDIVFKKQLDDELAARVQLVLLKSCRTEDISSLLFVGGLVLNPEKFELTVDGIPVELTFKEYELLKFLIENQNKVFSRNKLLSVIWGYDFYGGSRTVDVHMRRLRAKIGSPYSDMIKTVRNVGYMFSP